MNVLAPDQPYRGPILGEHSGGNWIALGNLCSLAPGTLSAEVTLRRPPTNVHFCHQLAGGFGAGASLSRQDSYLVDSASSHMLVSKIKPCMSKYKQLYRETANGSLNQLSFI